MVGYNIEAQELILGGDMESDEYWTVLDLAVGNGHTETFGYTEATPEGGEDGCLNMAGSGNWSNAAVCQEITVTKGVEYMISMAVMTLNDFVPESNWVEIVLVDEMPTVDADITSHPNVFALNSWDCSDVTQVNGSFADFNCDAKSPVNDIIYYEGTGDTTVVLVLKTGGNNEYSVLLDNVSVYGEASAVQFNSSNPALNVFPNPVGDELNIRLDNSIEEVELFNLTGQSVYSMKNIGLQNVKIEVSTLASGIYLGVVRDSNGNTSMFKSLKK